MSVEERAQGRETPGDRSAVGPGSGIGVPDALAELRAGAVLVDVRTPSNCRREHASPAIHIQLGWLATDVPRAASGADDRHDLLLRQQGVPGGRAVGRRRPGVLHHRGLRAWRAAGCRSSRR